MRRISRRAVALALVTGLAAAACGSDHGEDDEAAQTTVPVTAAAGATTSTTPPGEAFGTLESPCGEGDASGATSNGVTDTEITIGYGDDSDYPPAPGLTRDWLLSLRAELLAERENSAPLG